MGFFDDFKNRLSGLTEEFKKFKNKDILNSVMAACAYIAAADGHIDPEEKRKMIGLVKNSPLISVYGADNAIKVFTEHADRFDFDFEIGKTEALRIISKHRGNSEIARLIIRAAIMIGNSDGNFDNNEKTAVRTIINELGENPSDFDL
ncbi:tellurite resistance TerB family protein [Commensalibacter communis]|uniref:Tellurite resistance protein TerB (TerB) n=1 Tax=Commensalibacter communis TaxID=2972786 RepID=A0A9W4XD74_9PROT|nr:tellurite resistance TerB family protein [Commensalibacter communis]CAI3938860.1 Tellurite resistance protein TerB (TerB) (PDB:2JXU) (PUBMED:23044854 [Commensalibacter communis]CAI3939055.1 Tellurite resistance protein TerB (TerB) (PDB:2JXU) (PUBMED:23044854 [Commensalibacter communis]CAI3939340.1 Tellurite resistance protein TerB (TerB) (PDB:2JXU) (PUBMED:23044854 [Commensalibacter communis]CAI3941290.1 Tellurite resistance protein TerB (TerB) (PDB:2JXU) (PUBMED:23044854 [Commensalibacter c